jgi:hypothetical protein
VSNFEIRDNSGSLFVNDRKGDNERAPNAKGKAMIGGVMYWVSAWTKTAASSGQKYQSLSFEVMQPMGDQGQQQQQRPAANKPVGANFSHPPRKPNPPAQQPFGDEEEFTEDSIPFDSAPARHRW